MMKAYLFALLMLILCSWPCQMIMLIFEKDSGVYIDYDNRVSYNEKDTGNLVGTFENFTYRLELDITENEKAFKFFIKKRLAWDAYKLKLAGTGKWEAVGTTLKLRFDSKKRNFTNKYCIEVYMDQIYLVKMEEQAGFFEQVGIRKYTDEEMNMLYIKELLNNRFLVKLE